ncbi:DUF2975 domain-containing protein [Chryseobacterium sp. MFBS3-17]|uniref:DUF2975 domain-containing protein n=1 Tax=Chryseobacterium sp. MFBS3-17 TaxID=2886689 RepID=UPI001D0DF8E4|nr:DUF2975 domain-containing protein [Chryseobacterium sp. MFBS3-17]MCC2589728.1 DUF2975 domain-containing protein [Chryseobacterium sp. MFBS3-17]
MVKSNTDSVLLFLRLVLWAALISSVLAFAAVLVHGFALLLNADFQFLSNLNITIGHQNLTAEDLREAGTVKFLLFAVTITAYLLLFIRLIAFALKILNKVDFENPFKAEISALISKMGTVALQLGILDFLSAALFSAIFHGEFRVDISFGNLNFFVIAAILYIISLIFRRGTELQSETDLTI